MLISQFSTNIFLQKSPRRSQNRLFRSFFGTQHSLIRFESILAVLVGGTIGTSTYDLGFRNPQNINIDAHFRMAKGMVSIDSVSVREIKDYLLTCYPFYLIDMNVSNK